MQKLLYALDAVSTAHVLVVGDLILDHYIYGQTDRTSPEAPVPVVLVAAEKYVAGGAANVARNLVAAGASAHCVGLLGTDKSAAALCDAMLAGGVGSDNVVESIQRQTVQKTRVVSQGQQIVRLDREDVLPPTKEETADLWAKVEPLLSTCTAIVASDYAKGALSDELLARLVRAARKQGVPLFVDPKGSNYARYRGCHVITPNAREAREAANLPATNEAELKAAAGKIRENAHCDAVVITRGADGLAMLLPDNRMILAPAGAREVFDVTGAGDTFVAWMAAAVGGGADLESAARLANVAAGIAVGKAGAAAVSPHEVRQALMPGRLGRKLLTDGSLRTMGQELRGLGKRIVLANGCFDFLHAGHVDFFERARELGDVLVVATNTDEAIRKIKGEGRPVIPGPQRQVLLASVEAVDYVVMFSEPTPHRLIEELRPHVLAKGANFTAEQVEGADLVKGYGGEVALVPVAYDFSTGNLFGG